MPTYSKTGSAGLGKLPLLNIGGAKTTLTASGSSFHGAVGAETAKSGIGVLGAIPFIKSGSGVSIWVGSGTEVHNSDKTKTGAGVSAWAASGGKTNVVANIIPKTGVAAIGAIPKQRTGSATTAWSGSGASVAVLRLVKRGGGAGGSGTPSFGLLTLSRAPGWSATGTRKLNSIIKTGSGITALGASGPRSLVKSTSGGGAGGTGTPRYGMLSLAAPIGWQARGAMEHHVTRTGAAITVRTASGAKLFIPFTVISKTGTAITALGGSGLSIRIRPAINPVTGTGALRTVASGSKQFLPSQTHVKSGGAVERFVASGADTFLPYTEIARAGAGVTRVVVSGFKSVGVVTSNYLKTGSGALGLSASGNQLLPNFIIRSGSAAIAYLGAGANSTHFLTWIKEGHSIARLTALGAREIETPTSVVLRTVDGKVAARTIPYVIDLAVDDAGGIVLRVPSVN
ncbi:hypothetical protein [Candidatus Solirubrobacter pratensis]|uniref:hypothetical protein n=1 Tax=Candidatus Solirubrobacter pratensis TaxID=1298857 RepID=UPI0003F65299|nr:hypothetical protein [Candidatus Solirubrobacter pratensis]